MSSNQGRKVRVVAKVRGFTDLELECGDGVSSNWISAHKPNEEESVSASVSFGDHSAGRKEFYEVDYSYEQTEDNGSIFSKEVKPLISRVFDGHDATVIACGARGSGKTYLIQGSDEKPGVAVHAMTEFLSVAEKNGTSISLSLYEIFQDQVCDFLDPERSKISVLEDAQGKIQLKGLSQVPVKSVSEFEKMYFGGRSLHKQMQKIAIEHRRSHKGVIIYVSSHNEQSDALLVGKMNFVDLAGYEDSRRKSIDGHALAENVRTNKSIYALHNVVYALSANESHIPYRESKLTHMLKDSLGRTNRILIVTCLNPHFCQESIYMVSLASRCCQVSNRAVSDSTKKAKSAAKALLLSSQNIQIPGSVPGRKQTGSKVQLSEKKPKVNNMASAMKGRKLFNESSHSTKSEKTSKKGMRSSDIVSIVESSVREEEKSTSDAAKALSAEEEKPTSDLAKAVVHREVEASLSGVPHAQETILTDKAVCLRGEDNHEEVTANIKRTPKGVSSIKGQTIAKENDCFLVNEAASPPLSARLQELSNNLKMLFTSTASHMDVLPVNNTSSDSVAPTDNVEPKTPEQSVKGDDIWEISNINSPWQTFSVHSSRVKSSLVQEYLRFINTASKEELKRLKGIGEKRATYILELRNQTPEPFKDLDDLKGVGLSAKQVKGMMTKEIGELFN